MPFAEPAELLVPHGGQREGVQQQDHVGVRQPEVRMVDAGVLQHHVGHRPSRALRCR
jgi:hypothetical protein